MPFTYASVAGMFYIIKKCTAIRTIFTKMRVKKGVAVDCRGKEAVVGPGTDRLVLKLRPSFKCG